MGSEQSTLRHVPMEYHNSNNDMDMDVDSVSESLVSYVVNCISLADLNSVLVQKMTKNISDDSLESLSDEAIVKFINECKQMKKNICLDVVESVQTISEEKLVIWKLVHCITTAIGVDAYRVYKISPNKKEPVQYYVTSNISELAEPKYLSRASSKQSKLVKETMRRGTSWCISRLEYPATFPGTPHNLFRFFGVDYENSSEFIMYQPILTAESETSYVVEMWRVDKSFTDKDKEICSNFQIWGSLILYSWSLILDRFQERSVSDFLLDLVKEIFEDISFDVIIQKIIELAQKIVDCDNVSLFLVEMNRSERLTTVLNMRFEPEHERKMKKKEIDVPFNCGIVGHVAKSKEKMNVPDVNSDHRFDRNVDEINDCKILNILSMPIVVQNKVIAVMQMANKRGRDAFDCEDEEAFETLSKFLGLALYQARFYDQIKQKERQCDAILENLSLKLIAPKAREIEKPFEITDINVHPSSLTELEKITSLINMFDDLFDLSNFDLLTLTQFLITIKRTYKKVPYHNFDHGWNTAHSMYLILKCDKTNFFDYNMRLAMFVASLCHDVNHKPLYHSYKDGVSAICSSSDERNYEYFLAVLELSGHNILNKFPLRHYNEILFYIKCCVEATDLRNFRFIYEKLRKLMVQQSNYRKLEWSCAYNRLLAASVAMVAADLSAAAKSWDIQLITVEEVFEILRSEGDKERILGNQPSRVMDRYLPEHQAKSLVILLQTYVLPSYTMLQILLPATKPMQLTAIKNHNKWAARARVCKYRLTRIIEEENEDAEDQYSSYYFTREYNEVGFEHTSAGNIEHQEVDMTKVMLESIQEEDDEMIDFEESTTAEIQLDLSDEDGEDIMTAIQSQHQNIEVDEEDLLEILGNDCELDENESNEALEKYIEVLDETSNYDQINRRGEDEDVTEL